MPRIFRYDTHMGVVTPLNPIEDLMSWIAGLRSIGYTSDILKTKHNMTAKRAIQKSSQLISLFAENTLGLLDQAYSGPEGLSFLPLYYAILNLSKVYIVLSGNLRLLDSNRYHGASYNPDQKSSRDLLNEEVVLRKNGVLPLFYKSITNETWNFNNRKIKLGDVYPYIFGITYEFEHAYKNPIAIQGTNIEIVGGVKQGYRLKVRLAESQHSLANKRSCLKLLNGHYKYDAKQKVYFSEAVAESSVEAAQSILANKIRRYLIYSTSGNMGSPISLTPLSAKHFLLPEEVPIWLAFFHLANVVRYNPEFIAKLANSKAWPMLLALRKHTILQFLTLFWSYLHQSNYYFILR